MTDEWRNSYDDDLGIVRIEGTPFPNRDGILSRREKSLFARLRDWLFPVINDSEEGNPVNHEMERAYTEGDRAPKTNKATQLIADAADAAVKADVDRALTRPEPDEKAQRLFEQLDELQDYLENEQDTAFAQLIEGDDRAMEQVEVIRSILRDLRLRRGTIVNVLKDSGATVGGETGEGTASAPK